MSLRKKLAIKFSQSKFKILSAISTRKAAEKAFQLFTTPQSRNTRALPPEFQKAEKLQFTFSNILIRGYRWNHPSDKKLLILHGYESSVVNFDHFINPLIKKGYEILAFDAPANGRSGGKSINVLEYKNFIHHINDQFGPIQSFISHSFGSLALSLALEEIPHDELHKVVFIAPATETSTAIDNYFKFLNLNDILRKEFEKIIAEVNNKPSTWYSLARAAENIKATVLFLQDKKDDQTPYSDVEPIIKKQYNNFKFIISEGLGHSRIYRDPASVKAIIQFL